MGPRGAPLGPEGPRGAAEGAWMGAGGPQRGFLPELRPGISKTVRFGVRFRVVSGSFPGRSRVVFANLENGFGPFSSFASEVAFLPFFAFFFHFWYSLGKLCRFLPFFALF